MRCAPTDPLQHLLYFVRDPWPWGKPHEGDGLQNGAAIRRLEEILAEEDEAELARAKVEWLESFHNAVRDDALIAEFDM